MKIFYIECTEDELRANRGIMDAIVDACRGIVDAFYGTQTHVCKPEEPEESEDNDEQGD